jgi:hypothetical protein
MVASASSSNTQCPSGRCKSMSARLAASMLRSTAGATLDHFSSIDTFPVLPITPGR